MEDPEIELVLNLTYASAHYEVSKQILSSGKHCYSEKMMCVTKEEADCLMALAKEKGLMFAVGPDTFLGASMQTVRYIVEKGLIGQVIQVIVHRNRGYHMIKTTGDDNYRKYSVMCGRYSLRYGRLPSACSI